MNRPLYLGAISGTSLDGVDLALAAIEEPFELELIARHTEPFAPSVRDELLDAMAAPALSAARLVALHSALGWLFARAIANFLDRAQTPPTALRAIGMHGVTFRHEPEPLETLGVQARGTLQLGDPHVVRAETGAPVMFDFRHADMAHGGQGAPLACFLDRLMFGGTTRRRILLNLGGIANATALAPGQGVVSAFDTGPANMVIDALMRQYPGAPQPYDRDGACAARGQVIEPLLNDCLRCPYFQQEPPKSTGRELFGDSFTAKFLNWPGDHGYDDLVATAARLTAQSATDAIHRWIAPTDELADETEIIVSGGGAHNRTVMAMLRELTPRMAIVTTAAYGLDPDAKEAVLMAALAWARDRSLPANEPDATGARRRVVLGASTG